MKSSIVWGVYSHENGNINLMMFYFVSNIFDDKKMMIQLIMFRMSL